MAGYWVAGMALERACAHAWQDCRCLLVQLGRGDGLCSAAVAMPVASSHAQHRLLLEAGSRLASVCMFGNVWHAV